MRNSKIGRGILDYLLLGGALTLAMFSPVGGPRLAKNLLKQLKYKLSQIRTNVYYLKKRGLVEFIRENNKEILIKITKEGRKYLKKFDIDKLALNKPIKWDGKWRLVIFDIPEKHRKGRDALRKKLKDMNFFRFQDSVWITPYFCDDEIRFLKEVFNIPAGIEIITTTDLGYYESKVKNFFKLT